MQRINLPTVDLAKVEATLMPTLAPYAESLKRAAAEIDATELSEGLRQFHETFRRAGEQMRAAAEARR